MGPDLVVKAPPGFDGRSCVRDRREPVQVQAVVAEGSIEAFDEAVLHRLARLDELELHAGLDPSTIDTYDCCTIIRIGDP